MDIAWVSTVTMGMFPVSFAFALQYAHLTTFALHIGVSDTFSSLVWLCGPVTGLVIQPLVGQFSDICHLKIGRRRPFIILGAIALASSQLAVAFSTDIGFFFGDRGASHAVALGVFIASFWVYDAANNVFAISLRALLCDIVPYSRMQLAFSLQQVWSSMGYICGYYISQIRWVTIADMQFFHWSSTCPITCAASHSAMDCPPEYVSGCFDLKVSFLLSACITIACAVIVCITAREKRQHGHAPIELNLCAALSDVPEEMHVIYLASLLSWFGWFSALVYQVNFVTREVIKAETESQVEDAERSAFFGLMMGSVISAVTSLCIPSITRHRISRSFLVWSASCGILAVILAIAPLVAYTGNLNFGVIWLASFGVVYAVTNSIPYSLLSLMVNEHKESLSAGKAMGLLNVAVCIPQIITSVLGGPVISQFHSDIPCFIIGAMCAAAACAVLRDKVNQLRQGYTRAPDDIPSIHSVQ